MSSTSLRNPNEKILYDGFLYRQGLWFLTWKKEHVILALSNNNLIFRSLDNKSQVKDQANILRTADKQGGKFGVEEMDIVHHLQKCLAVYTSSKGKNRRFLVHAETVDETSKFKKALLEGLQAANADPNAKKPAAKTSSKVLVIVCSPMGPHSASTSVTNSFITNYQKHFPSDQIKILNLGNKELPPFTAQRVQAKFATWAGLELQGAEKEWNVTKEIIDEFVDADKYVFAVPMWNLGIPNNLKLYFDHIVQPWKTFDPTKEQGGLVVNKPAALICASGVGLLGSSFDYASTYMLSILGYIGFTDVRTVFVNGSADPNILPQLVEKASKEAAELAKIFTFNPKATLQLKFPTSPEPGPTKFPLGKKVLAITSSPMGKFSSSTALTEAFLARYKQIIPDATITTLDIFHKGLPPFTAKRVQAKFSSWAKQPEPESTQNEWAITKQIIDEFLWADTFVIASPMWNLGIPNQLKLYFDHIVQPWKTFDPTKPSGGGLITNKPVFLFCSSGAGLLGTNYDFTSTYLRSILSYIGFTDFRSVNINGTSNPELSSSLLEKAIGEAVAMLPEPGPKEAPGVKTSIQTPSVDAAQKKPKRTHTKVLVITSSPMAQHSTSTKTSEEFINQYKAQFPSDEVVVLDLSQKGLQPFTAARVQAKFANWAGQSEPEGSAESWNYTKELIDEFLDADKYVFAVPMWNLGIPNLLKLFLDHIVQPFKTVDPSKMDGGLVRGKPALLICSSGGGILGSPFDFVSTYLKAILGYIGFTDIRTVFLNGTSDQKQVSSILDKARQEITSIVPKFNFDAEAKVELNMTPLPPLPSDNFPCGKRVLAIIASPMGKFSASTTITNAFLEAYKQRVPDVTIQFFDVFTKGLPPFSAKRVLAKFSTWSGQPEPEGSAEEWALTKQIIDDFKWADTYIFAVPMWNLAIPNQLKLFFDHIVQPWKTFDPTKQVGGGLISGKPAFVFASSGAGLLGTPYDFVTNYLQGILSYIGFTDIRTVFANGTADPSRAADIIGKASEEAIGLLKDVVTTFEPKSGVEKVLKQFEEMQIAGDPKGIAGVFSEDGMLMADKKSTAIGRVAVEGVFRELLKEDGLLNLRLQVEDIIEIGGVAYATTYSKGKTSDGTPVERRDLFVFKKEKEEWCIASYMFNSRQ